MNVESAGPIDVLVVSNLYPPVQIGGYEIAAADIVEGLREAGLKVHVLTSNYKIDDVTKNESDVSRILELSNDWFAPKGTPDDTEKIRRNYTTMKQILQRHRPRAVYVWNICHLGPGVVVVPCEENIPVVHHVMGYDLLSFRSPLSGIRLLISRFLGKIPKKCLQDSHFRKMIFISRYVQNHYKRLGVSPQLSEIVYPGIKCDQVCVKTEYPVLQANVNIVYSGQLVKHKGVLKMLAAVELAAVQLPGNCLRLTLYGDGPSEIIDRMISSSSVSVNHKGFVNREQLYKELCTHDIGVFPSLWEEPFGIAQVELMAAGLPILASARGGSAEAVQDGKTALIYDAEDPQHMAARLVDLITNYNTIGEKLGVAAVKAVHSRFDRRASIEGVWNVLIQAMDNSKTQLAGK